VNAAVLCRRFGTAALVLALAAGGAVVGRAAGGDPSLRLFVTKSERTVVRRDSRRPVFLNLGLFITSVGGPFELEVRRSSYRTPITVEQVVHSPTGDDSRPLPADILEGWEGLRDFLKVEVTNAAGRVVARRAADVCPNSFERERVNDEGPINPTYPVFCFANPFTKGMVWSIDEGVGVEPVRLLRRPENEGARRHLYRYLQDRGAIPGTLRGLTRRWSRDGGPHGRHPEEGLHSLWSTWFAATGRTVPRAHPEPGRAGGRRPASKHPAGPARSPIVGHRSHLPSRSRLPGVRVDGVGRRRVAPRGRGLPS
jgi:hypothetical protein